MSDTLVGALVGAAAAIIGGLAGQILTYVFSKRASLLVEKKEAYEAAEKLLFDVIFIDDSLTDFQLGDEYRQRFNNATTKLVLYAPGNIVELFSTVYSQMRLRNIDEGNEAEIEKNASKLIDAMRKDLGAKNK